MDNPFTYYLHIIVILLVPVILIFGIVQIIPTDAYLSFEYGKSDFPADQFGFDPVMQFSHAAANLKFVRTGQPISALAQQTHNQTPLYNSRELKHMQDVQRIFISIGQIWRSGILFLLFALLIYWVHPDSRFSLLPAMKIGGLLTAGLVAALGLLAIVAWQGWFVIFHEVFFPPGSWTFSITDTLVRLFPEKFWFDTAINVSVASLAAGLILFVSGWGIDRLSLKSKFQTIP